MSKLSASSNANILGTLSIYVVPVGKTFEEGAQCIFRDMLNKITNSARAHLLHLAIDNPPVYAVNPITEFRIGSGGAARTPTGSETSLYAQINPSGKYNATALAKSYDPTGMVHTFTFELGPSECNGLTISEVGLVANNNWLNNPAKGKLFNIKTFSEIFKSPGFSLVFVWKINFSGVYIHG